MEDFLWPQHTYISYTEEQLILKGMNIERNEHTHKNQNLCQYSRVRQASFGQLYLISDSYKITGLDCNDHRIYNDYSEVLRGTAKKVLRTFLFRRITVINALWDSLHAPRFRQYNESQQTIFPYISNNVF